jgi:hypothetical protein
MMSMVCSFLVEDGPIQWESCKSISDANCLQIAPSFIENFNAKTLRKPFGVYGGDDGARTRDLCRDRAAL